MKLEDYLKKDNMNETIVSDDVFNKIKDVGNKLGVHVARSDTFFDFLKKSEKTFTDVISLVCDYINTDDKNEKLELKTEIKHKVHNINKRQILSFILSAEKMSIGLVSTILKVMASFIGVDIHTYDHWLKDINYILTSLEKVKEVLVKIDATDEEMDAYNNFYNIIVSTKTRMNEDATISGSEKAITTNSIEKFFQPIPKQPMRRRKKKPNLKKLM